MSDSTDFSLHGKCLKLLRKCGLFRRFARRKLLVSKEDLFGKLHQKKPQELWKNVLWAADSTSPPWQKPNGKSAQMPHTKHVKHSDGGGVGSCNRTVIPTRPGDLQQNDWKRKVSRCCNGTVKVQTSTGWNAVVQILMKWSNVGKRRVCIFYPALTQDPILVSIQY